MSRHDAAHTAVLLRDLQRISRRWQLYAVRLALAVPGVVIAVYASILVLVVMGRDVSQLATLGRGVFYVVIGFQLAIAMVLAPVLVASAIREEIDGGTLDLLTISHLRPWQVLWGKTTAGGAMTLTGLLGTVPIVLMVLSFGGVDSWEVLNSVSNIALLMVLCTLVTAPLALVLDSAIAPPVFALIGVMLLTLLVPAVGVSPFFSMHLTSAEGLQPWLVYLPSIATLLHVGPVVQRVVATAGTGAFAGGRNADVARLERYRRFTWYLLLPLIGGHLWLQSHPAAHVAALAELSLAGVLLTRFYVQTLVGWARWRAARDQRRASRVRAGLRSLIRRRYLVNPVGWRGALTRSSGGVSTVTRLAFGVYVGSCLAFFVAEPRALFDDEAHYPMMLFGAVVVGLVTVLGATSAVVEERARGTLAPMMHTTLARYRVITGYTFAVGVRTLPFALWIGLLWVTNDRFVTGWRHHEYAYAASPLAITLHVLLGVSWWAGVWLLIVATCQVVALFTPRPRLAWLAAFGAVSGLASTYLSTMLALAIAHELTKVRGIETLVYVLMPFAAQSWWDMQEVPGEMVVSLVGLWLLALGTWAGAWLVLDLWRSRRPG